MALKKQLRIYEAVPEKDFVTLMKTTRKTIHKISFILAYGSGLRISEIIKLNPEDINLEEHKIFIRQAKGAKDRVVNTPKWLKSTHLNFFPLKIGRRAIQQAFLRKSMVFNSVLYTDKAGRKRYRYHFHSLRSSFAMRSLKQGVPVNYVQALLGHASLETTSKYTKADPIDAIKEIVDKGI